MIIVAQSTQTQIEIGLHDEAHMINQVSLHKHAASAQLIPTLDTLLSSAGVALTNITGIIVNTGPAPFTSLRTVIATMNGIAFASQIPLYGVPVFEALIDTHDPDNHKTVLALLPAYSGAYYYGLRASGTPLRMGTVLPAALLQLQKNPDLLMMAGMDAATTESINAHYDASLSRILVPYSTLDSVAQCGLMQIKKGISGTFHLSPCYIKTHF